MPNKPLDLTGMKFGMLTAIRRTDRVYSGRRYYWLFRCDCGKEKIAPCTTVKRGSCKSCGCIRRGYKTHGMKHTKIYRTWIAMVERCENPNHKSYSGYGGRGIKVCKRWRKFENFYSDFGSKRPSPNHSIDRINVDGGYTPGNCRWATVREQSNNKSNTIYVLHE